MSAVTLSPPRIHVSPMMTQIGMVYSSTMNSPYIAARKRPWALLCDPLMKKETVMGTIGNTQGVSSIARPHRMASRISAHRGDPPVPAPGAGETLTAKSQSSGIPHASPWQLWKVRVPRTSAFLSTRTCWRMT